MSSQILPAIPLFLAESNYLRQRLGGELLKLEKCFDSSILNILKNVTLDYPQAISDLAPNGLIEIENKTVFLLNSKRILMMKKLLYLTGFIGSISLTAGVTFKLLRMPYGYELFTVGFLTLLLVFIPLLALDRYKVAISKAISEKMKIILGVAAAIITGLSGLFKLMHLQGADLLLMLGAFVFAFGFLPFFFFTMYKKSVA